MRTVLTKTFNIAAITWKSLLIYRADAWLNVLFAGARVLLTFLLWSAVFAGKDMVGGYTLPMMITYAIFSTQLAMLQHKDDHAWQLATEVREGAFSKYLTHPIAITQHFFGLWLGQWSYQLVLTLITIAVWSLAFTRYITIQLQPDLLWLVLIIPLGGILMMIFNHTISLLALKLKETTGLLIFKNNLIELVSGALIPLQLLPDWLTNGLQYTPFYSVIYFPVSLILGENTQHPILAVLSLILWSGVFLMLSQIWLKRAHRFYEGVGI